MSDWTNYGAVPKAGDRIELHPGMDLWMMGDRYGDVIDVRPTRPAAGLESDYAIRVKLDRSGKTYRVNRHQVRIID